MLLSVCQNWSGNVVFTPSGDHEIGEVIQQVWKNPLQSSVVASQPQETLDLAGGSGCGHGGNGGKEFQSCQIS